MRSLELLDNPKEAKEYLKDRSLGISDLSISIDVLSRDFIIIPKKELPNYCITTWSREDIKDICDQSNIDISNKQIESVLFKMEKCFDSTVGMDWNIIFNYIKEEVGAEFPTFKITDFFTEKEIKDAYKIFKKNKNKELHSTLAKFVAPLMPKVNKLTNKENNIDYVAYTLEYICMKLEANGV